MQYVLYKWKNQYGGKYNNKMNSMIVLPLQHYLSRKKQRNSTKERDYILQVQESCALRCKEARKVHTPHYQMEVLIRTQFNATFKNLKMTSLKTRALLKGEDIEKE